MKKNKERNVLHTFLRFLARLLILNAPVAVLLISLVFLGRIAPLWAGIIFVIAFTITTFITRFVFQDLEDFISYLKKLGQGLEIEPPRFRRGIFSSSRLANTFMSVKNLWWNQTLSDARILENLSDPLIMINETQEIVFANVSARSFFGDDVFGKNVLRLFRADSFSTAFRHVFKNEVSVQGLEWQLKEESGKIYTFQTRIERLPAPAKNGGTIVISMHDITPFKIFKQQQADFFANASHELKTPLAVVSGFIETLQGPAKDDPEAQEKFLSMMAEQTDRMKNLVQDLLKLSRLQMTEKRSENDVLLLGDLLNSILEDLKIRARKYHKRLEMNIKHDLPRFFGNRQELYQVFQNLIDNAIKYGAKNSIVSVNVRLCNGFPHKSEKYYSDMRQVVAVAVHNTGDTIPPDHINRLFDRFYRVDSTQARQVEGTGLGLGIAQQIVQKHDGIIDVASNEDGTTFTVYLPIDI